MANSEKSFIYIGIYTSKAAARDDYRIVRDLYHDDLLGSYDSAVVTKGRHGRVHVNKDEMAARHGAWGGAVVGALVGILYPPALIGFAIGGAGVGELTGHLWRGISRSDVKELGELIDVGEAALLVVGANPLADRLGDTGLTPSRHLTCELALQWDELELLEALRDDALVTG